MQILSQPPIADEATAERVIEWFLAGYEPLLFAADFGLSPEQVIDQIRWTLALYVRKLSRKGTGRKPIGEKAMSSTERAKRARKKKREKKAID